jgi:hypothetical protein
MIYSVRIPYSSLSLANVLYLTIISVFQNIAKAGTVSRAIDSFPLNISEALWPYSSIKDIMIFNLQLYWLKQITIRLRKYSTSVCSIEEWFWEILTYLPKIIFIEQITILIYYTGVQWTHRNCSTHDWNLAEYQIKSGWSNEYSSSNTFTGSYTVWEVSMAAMLILLGKVN